ncbi:transmembrane amino acid transporter protein-domain-containing protein [Jimgerdemannia flammicorona]|uniref:Transmembrane amino acid transporter protein-domain-containing protein n=1 Tax=Jimgerdemannia flammicorona TaxID=994334 RepID=A0A433D4U2_9FUNG|nr:transmembrane amino acid transporter protein-domain-containing protein [Jimgerdemannia flammicorona]
MTTIHLGAFLILTPMVFLPVRNLSYTSLIGIISAASLVVVVMYDGLSKDERPGSLRDPMDTDIFPSDWKTVPLSFGLIMSGFAGHAVFPTIYKDMAEPKRYTGVVNYSYGITFVMYLLMAASGYAMFGITTMQEITQNIVNVPGYDPLLNKLAVWLIAVNPIAKYALTLNPVSLTWERHLLKRGSLEDWCNSGRGRRTAIYILGRCTVSALVVIIAIIFPGFDRVMVSSIAVQDWSWVHFSPRRILFLPHLGHLPARLPPTPVWSLHSRHSATLRTDLAHYLVLTGDGWHRVEPPPTSHCVKLSKLWGRFNLCMVGWVVEVSGGVQIVVDFVLLSYEFNI